MDTNYKKNTRYEVLTPDGWKSFDGIRVSSKSSYLTIKTNRGIGSLRASKNHKVRVDGIWKFAEALCVGDSLDHKDGHTSVLATEAVEAEIDLYDLVEVDGGYQYYTDGIVSHNCQFLGSQETLIKASKIASLVFQTPLMETEDGLAIYENPVRGHIYTGLVDSSRSIGQDYNALLVLDVTSMPYKVVAKYRNNTIPVPVFPNLIKTIMDKYNEGYVLVEINDTGQQVADILKDELEYENIVTISIKGKKGQKVGEGFGGGRIHNGVKMSGQVKKAGCAVIKEMIENDKLIINDFDIISEISTYIAKAGSYEATDGYHDDLVACLVLFGWLTTQDYFKDLVNLDVRKRLFEEKLKKLEENLTPFGFLDSVDGEMDEAARMLASESVQKPKQSKRDRSWIDDANEIM